MNRERRDNAAAIPPYFKAVSGSLGGLVEASCLQPIDVIKTRLQLDPRREYRGICTAAPRSLSAKAPARYGRD